MAKENLNFKAAFNELQTISTRIKNEEIEIDVLPETIRRAKFLVNYCQELLHKVELELTEPGDLSN